MNKRTLVILSGGQDSTTCLAWAIDKFGVDNVYTITFDYGQRHKIEIIQAMKIAQAYQVKHKMIKLEGIKQVSKSALLEDTTDISAQHSISSDLPASFVPGRNIVFITHAAAYAYGLNIQNLVTGVCQTDFSGYPDCRQDFITSLQLTLNLGMDYDFKIHTPLMYLTKSESIHLMDNLGELAMLRMTQTCYEGLNPPCEKCPACTIRAAGFEEAGYKDPLLVDSHDDFGTSEDCMERFCAAKEVYECGGVGGFICKKHDRGCPEHNPFPEETFGPEKAVLCRETEDCVFVDENSICTFCRRPKL